MLPPRFRGCFPLLFCLAATGLFVLPALAQTVGPAAPPPALVPDAAGILTYLGLGQYVAGIASIIALVGYAITHMMPWVPVPVAGASGVWPMAYTVLSWIAGNYGRALNQAVATAAKTVPLLMLGVLLALSACGQTVAGVTTMPAPATPDQALFETETDYDLALHQLNVVSLCTATVTTACLTGPQEAQAYTAAVAGANALTAAKGAVGVYDALATPGASDSAKATAAIAALAAVTPQLLALVPAK
jgi:hypothetical protein